VLEARLSAEEGSQKRKADGQKSGSSTPKKAKR